MEDKTKEKNKSIENLSKSKASQASGSLDSTDLKDNKNKDTVKSKQGKEGQAGENTSNLLKWKTSHADNSSSNSVNTKVNKKKELIAVIRIAGMVKVKSEIKNTLERLGLLRKYSCVLLNSNNKSLKGMLEKVKHYVAYGVVDKDTLVKLIKERGRGMEKGGKIDAEKVTLGLLEGKKLSDFKLKPFFRLHPPRKGIRSKLQYPKGVLGNNKKDINKLIARML